MRRRLTVRLDQGTDLECQSPAELAIHVGDQCVVKTDRSMEFGRITRIQDNMPAGSIEARLPQVLRRATLQDQSKASENSVHSKMAQSLCLKKMAELKLEMHLISVRYSFDRSVLHITFMSEERVDFRELVRQLGSELNAQVEVRQIGVRDAAKLVGGFGACGEVLCCRRWLKSFAAVGVKMAKAQRLSLNPNTISGICGRLKCCLRYEFDTYRQCAEGLPREGAPVRCGTETGIVIDRNILARRVKVRFADQRILEFDGAEVTPLGGGPAHEPEIDDKSEMLEDAR